MRCDHIGDGCVGQGVFGRRARWSEAPCSSRHGACCTSTVAEGRSIVISCMRLRPMAVIRFGMLRRPVRLWMRVRRWCLLLLLRHVWMKWLPLERVILQSAFAQLGTRRSGGGDGMSQGCLLLLVAVVVGMMRSGVGVVRMMHALAAHDAWMAVHSGTRSRPSWQVAAAGSRVGGEIASLPPFPRSALRRSEQLKGRNEWLRGGFLSESR